MYQIRSRSVIIANMDPFATLVILTNFAMYANHAKWRGAMIACNAREVHVAIAVAYVILRGAS